MEAESESEERSDLVWIRTMEAESEALLSAKALLSFVNIQDGRLRRWREIATFATAFYPHTMKTSATEPDTICTTVINTQTGKPKKTAAIQQHDPY